MHMYAILSDDMPKGFRRKGRDNMQLNDKSKQLGNHFRKVSQ